MRLKQILAVLIVSLTISETIACKCMPLDSASAKKLVVEVDFLIIGRAIQNVGFKSELNNSWDQQEKGYDVLIEVDSIIKGNSQSKTIIVKQFYGNCDQIFKLGEQYLIAGYQLKRFINKSSKSSTNKEGEMSSTPPPPRAPTIHNTNVFLFNSKQEKVDYWNNLAKNNVIINTSICSSFAIDSSMAGYFLSRN